MNKEFGLTSTNEDANKHFDVYRGIVVDNVDPDKLGRIKVKVYPLFDGDETLTTEIIPWAIPAMSLFSGAGTDLGSFCVPSLNSMVWVFFERGDIYQPVYFAEAQDGVRGLPTSRETNYPYRKVWKTKEGIEIYLDDTDKQLSIQFPGVSGYSGYSGFSGHSGYSGVSGYSGIRILVDDFKQTAEMNFDGGRNIKVDNVSNYIKITDRKNAYYKVYDNPDLTDSAPQQDLISENGYGLSVRDRVITVNGCLTRLEYGGTIASASTLVVPSIGNFFTISGSTNITNIQIAAVNIPSQTYDTRAGTELTFAFSGTVNFLAGSGNIVSANGSFYGFVGAMITYIYDGTNWIEKSRNPTQLAGFTQMWQGTVANIPSGYLFCNGASYNTTTYAALYQAIGTSTLPDFRDRFPIGAKQDSSGIAKTNIEGSLQIEIQDTYGKTQPPTTHPVGSGPTSGEGGPQSPWSTNIPIFVPPYRATVIVIKT